MVLLNMLAKIKLLGLFVLLSLHGCSGNSDNAKAIANAEIKRFSGVVNNSSVTGVRMDAIPIGRYGQFRLNDEGNVDATSGVSDAFGRYGIAIEVEEVGPYIISAITIESDEDSVPKTMASKSTCQLAAGCNVSGSNVAFGVEYSLPSSLQWAAAVETVSDGQFIVVNPITEMARVFGFSDYINKSSDATVTSGSTAAPNYYSNYGVVKGNSQTASLLGLVDILSIEPINLFSLHQIEQEASTTIEHSIRYGALIAAWQQLELEHNESLSGDDSPFQVEVISEYVANNGQLYQASPLDGQLLSLKLWYETALTNLVNVRDYHAGLGRSLSNEVDIVISRFQQEMSSLQDNELSSAKPTISKELQSTYVDAVAKTKAMVEYVSNLKNNFATDEFRLSVKNASSLVTDEVKRLAPKWDEMLKKLLSVYEYYLSCTQLTCNSQSEWHGVDNVYNSSDKKLTIGQAGGLTLEISQGLVFDSANPEGSVSTNVHDLFISGAFEIDGLRMEFSDFNSEVSESIRSSFRFSYNKVLTELPSRPALVVGGVGVTEDESLIPDAIELTLPDFKLYEPSANGTSHELVISGVFSALMVANTDVVDFTENLPETEKLGKRYNLSNVLATLKLVGGSRGSLANGAELRDNAVISLQAVASEAIASAGNAAAYFPDTTYPTFKAFFNSREGFAVGSASPRPLVVSRRGVMNFPKLDSEGSVAEDGSTDLVQYLELDYEVGGLERYVVYPKIGNDEKYWGLICSAQPEAEADLVDPEYTKVVKNDEGIDVVTALLTCEFRDKYDGAATTDAFINKIYSLNKDVVNLREFNGQGTYRIAYDTEVIGNDADGNEIRVLSAFSQVDDPHLGTIEQAIVLGVDSLRLQFQPELVNQANDAYLPEAVLDVSLAWRTHDVIDINVFVAFDAEQKFNNPDGSGLPYLATGSDVESYSVAYRTDNAGNESGEYAMSWSGVQFVDGPIDGSKVMKKTDVVNLKENVFVGVGSNVTYSPYSLRELKLQQSNGIDGSQATEEKCGFFARGGETQKGEDCDAIAYLTFRGLVTGSIREERDGVYVVRYIDDTWQVLGN